jgi:hypothetical protein
MTKFALWVQGSTSLTANAHGIAWLPYHLDALAVHYIPNVITNLTRDQNLEQVDSLVAKASRVTIYDKRL